MLCCLSIAAKLASKLICHLSFSYPAEEAKEEGEAEAAPEYDAAAGFAGAPLPSGEEAAGFDAYG